LKTNLDDHLMSTRIFTLMMNKIYQMRISNDNVRRSGG
jgi:hypothetical protein